MCEFGDLFVFRRHVIAFPFAAALFSLNETVVIFRVQLIDRFLHMVETSKRTPPAKRSKYLAVRLHSKIARFIQVGAP